MEWFLIKDAAAGTDVILPILEDAAPRQGMRTTHLEAAQTVLTTVRNGGVLHDTLTALPNRKLMLDLLNEGIREAERCGRGLAVALVGLQHIQQINDRHGLRGGDAVLIQVSARLRTQLRPGDTLVRSSGTEFLVIWRDLDPTNPSELLALSKNLVHALDSPVEVGMGLAPLPVSVSASAGVATYAAGRSVDELLQSAYDALQQANSQGPGQVVFFTDELGEAVLFRRSLEVELRRALAEPVDQFVLHYQPVIDLASGTVASVEALVRWQHPLRGLVGADEIIPVAEQTGLIHELGDWVLDRALRDAAALTYEGHELDVAVNLSVLQLDDRVVAKVQRALGVSGLRPSRLILEVTESAIVVDEVTVTGALEELSRLGVKIAIDDFGTGNSSLLYLRRYPISALKIDREFVAGIARSADDEAICHSITSLAAAVGATSVGEGVETPEQYAALRAMGCMHGQGFLWSPAVPLAELGAVFAACEKVRPAKRPSRVPQPPAQLPRAAATLVAAMQAESASFHTIAAALNRKVGLRPRGVRWTARSVQDALAIGDTHGSAPAQAEDAVERAAVPALATSGSRRALLYEIEHRDVG